MSNIQYYFSPKWNSLKFMAFLHQNPISAIFAILGKMTKITFSP